MNRYKIESALYQYKLTNYPGIRTTADTRPHE